MNNHVLPAAVLWDMDGTIIDSEPYWLASESAFAAAHDSHWGHDEGLGVIGMSLYESSKLLKERVGSSLEPQQIIDQITDDVLSQLERAILWRPGARELLQLLKENNVKTALVTGSMHRMAQKVSEQIGFDAFDTIVAGDDVVKGKPHPESYLRAAQILGVDPTNCVAFEDSHTGLSSAEAAGTKAVGIPHIVEIPKADGRILWRTLEGVSMADLRALFT
jgi:HAD superfamily hydrolase (TIGR01509 family)